MKFVLVFLLSLSFSTSYSYSNENKKQYNELTNRIQHTTVSGQGTDHLKKTTVKCSLEFGTTYTNSDDHYSVILRTPGDKGAYKMNSMTADRDHSAKIEKLASNVELYSLSYGYAECCHSGGRDISTIKVITKNKQKFIESIRLVEHQDIGPNFEEVLTMDFICTLEEPLLLGDK